MRSHDGKIKIRLMCQLSRSCVTSERRIQNRIQLWSLLVRRSDSLFAFYEFLQKLMKPQEHKENQWRRSQPDILTVGVCVCLNDLTIQMNCGWLQLNWKGLKLLFLGGVKCKCQTCKIFSSWRNCQHVAFDRWIKVTLTACQSRRRLTCFDYDREETREEWKKRQVRCNWVTAGESVLMLNVWQGFV